MGLRYQSALILTPRHDAVVVSVEFKNKSINIIHIYGLTWYRYIYFVLWNMYMCAYIRSRIRNYVPNLTFRFYPYPSHRIPLDELPFRVRMYLVMITIMAQSYLKRPRQSTRAFFCWFWFVVGFYFEPIGPFNASTMVSRFRRFDVKTVEIWERGTSHRWRE